MLFFSRINNRISAGEILEHPFIENFALSEAEIALKPIIEVEEPIEEVKQDEAIEVVEEFERMKLPTEILEGNDDTGYHPFDYPSENEMAYGQFRKHPNFQYFQKNNFSKCPCTFPLFSFFLLDFKLFSVPTTKSAHPYSGHANEHQPRDRATQNSGFN